MGRYPLLKDFTTSPIDLREVAFGTGGGITSSSHFTWTDGTSSSNLIASYGSTISTDSLFSAIVGGMSSSITESSHSVILGNERGCICGSSHSIILGGNCAGSVNYGLSYCSDEIIGGCNNLLHGGTYFKYGYYNYTYNYPNKIHSSCNSSIISGKNNTICCHSRYSSIISSRSSNIKGCYSPPNGGYASNVILGGYGGTIECAKDSLISSSSGSLISRGPFFAQVRAVSIISSQNSCVKSLADNVCGSAIISSRFSCIYGVSAFNNVIMSSYCSCFQGGGGGNSSFFNMMLGGCVNRILTCGSCLSISSIISSCGSTIRLASSSNIIGGLSSSITGTGSLMTIINSNCSTICSTPGLSSLNSTIIGGCRNFIGTQSSNSSILGGFNNCVKSSYNSAIIGGTGLSLVSCSNMVLVPRLSIATPSEINSSKTLVWNEGTLEVGWSSNAMSTSYLRLTEVGFGSTESSSLTSSNAFRYFDKAVNLDFDTITDGARPRLTETIEIGSNGFTASSLTNKNICNTTVIGFNNCVRSPNFATSIIGGCLNQISSACSHGSSIIGGQENLIGVTNSLTCGACRSSIIGGYRNTIVVGSTPPTRSFNSGIFSSYGATLSRSNYAVVIGGKFVTICCSGGSTILGGIGGPNTGTGSFPANLISGGCNNLISGGYYRKNESGPNYFTGNYIGDSISSVVLGGHYNRIVPGPSVCNNSFSTIIGGFYNYMKSSRASSILGGCCNMIKSRYGNIVGGAKNTIQLGATQSSIIGGSENTICGFGQYSSIINSCRSAIAEERGLILNSELSYLGPTQSASKPRLAEGNMIINSRCSIISGTAGGVNFIMGGSSHRIISTSSVFNVVTSGILGGSSNSIDTSDNAILIGGNNNKISSSGNSVILGGDNLTLSGETKTVYVDRFKARTIDFAGNTHSRVMIWSPNEYVNYRNLDEIATEISQDGVTGSTPYYTGSSWTWSSVNIYNVGNRVAIGATAPGTASSTLEVKGSLALTVKSVGQTTSSNLNAYTLTDRDFTVLAWGGVTISLPDASLAKHRLYVIKKMNAATQSLVDITPFAGDNIEGYNGGIQLVNQYDYNILQSDGYNMWIKLGGAVGFNL